MRIARDCGDVSSLFPPGVHHIWDLPHPLFHAIRLALGWLKFEELPEEERPPKSIWLDEERMNAWWAEVKRAREEKMKNPGSQSVMSMPQNKLMEELFGKGRG